MESPLPYTYSDDEPDCYVSIGQWMWTQFLGVFLVAVPILGWIGILILACVGKNATRKNYFRAIIIKMFLVLLVIAALSFYQWPQIQKYINRDQTAHQKAR